ncbi:MAG TPA: hypothetical protein VMV46_21765 [Thermoanaerobaculia bacterium]|nr:hypothetical protein [Thermoanaerobaculia bacterium]
MRYAANRPAVAARERFPARSLSEADGELWLVRLDGTPGALHLTHQANLDALGLDDRVSTGRIGVDRSGRDGGDLDPLLDTCGRLCDALYDWWQGAPPPIVYRARTTPSGRSLVLSEWTGLEVAAARPLREATVLHVHLVLRAGFTVPERWLG